jgi:hypothetical protein
VDDGWELVWDDDFDGPELDPDRWTAVQRGSNANDELQAYVADETWVEDGCLVLRSRRREWSGDGGHAELHVGAGHHTRQVRARGGPG